MITPGDAHVSNDAYAEFKSTSEHADKTYHFIVPAGLSIDGVEVRVEWHTNNASYPAIHPQKA